jgi:hypothetical protein
MGGSASVLGEASDAQQFKLFQSMKDKYESELKAKIDAGEMNDDQVFQYYSEYLASELTQHKTEIDKRKRELHNQWHIGDIVRSEVDGQTDLVEGVLVALHYDTENAEIDTGKQVLHAPINKLELVLEGHVVEIGDKVEVKESDDDYIWYSGVCTAVNSENGTIDVTLEGDDEDDKMVDVPLTRYRKLATGRELAILHWNSAKTKIQSVRKFIQAGALKKMNKLNSQLKGLSEAALDDLIDASLPSSEE